MSDLACETAGRLLANKFNYPDYKDPTHVVTQNEMYEYMKLLMSRLGIGAHKEADVIDCFNFYMKLYRGG
jgi:hypothetical protein